MRQKKNRKIWWKQICSFGSVKLLDSSKTNWKAKRDNAQMANISNQRGDITTNYKTWKR